MFLGQSNISTRKQVTFGSPLQDVHQVRINKKDNFYYIGT